MSVTPRALILRAAQRLRSAGIPDATNDAALLLAHLTQREALPLRLDTDTNLSDALVQQYDGLILQRANRVPLQWLTGHQSFCGLDFRVTPDVLIPRPETALLAERSIALGRSQPDFSLLDLCCGSGCIAVTCALALPGARVTACDDSRPALEVAEDNARRLGASVSFRQGDLLNAVPDQRFHLIASNPPYIPSGDCPELQPEVRREPLLALDGGADGLDFYRRIAREAPAHLYKGGALLLEVGMGQAEAVTRLLRAGGFEDISVTDDLAGIPRMVEGHIS